MPDHDKVTDETRTAEQRDAVATAGPGPTPSPEEEQAADRHRDLADAGVAAHEREMLELGAQVKGEGQVT